MLRFTLLLLMVCTLGCGKRANAKSASVNKSKGDQAETASPVGSTSIQSSEVNAQGHASADDNYRTLTGEEAKTALQKLLDEDLLADIRSDKKEALTESLKSQATRDRLAEAAPVRNGDTYALGPFFVDTKWRTFAVTLSIEGGHRYEVRGEFSRSADKDWVAKVIGAELRPPPKVKKW